MENVTKALLIAAAVIVVLVIIGLGMYYLNVGRDAMDTSTDTLDSAKVLAMNADLDNYQGMQNGSNVKKLIEIINAHNGKYANEPDFCIFINGSNNVNVTDSGTTNKSVHNYSRGTNDASGVIYNASVINAGNKYRVTFDYTTGGVIVNCRIKKVN